LKVWNEWVKRFSTECWHDPEYNCKISENKKDPWCWNVKVPRYDFQETIKKAYNFPKKGFSSLRFVGTLGAH